LRSGDSRDVRPGTDQIAVALSDEKTAVIELTLLDELFARKWIEADEDGRRIELTESGRYWLDRWVAKNDPHKRRRAA
jgi:hypothetical protein